MLACACRHKIELFGELADEAAGKLRKGQQIALHGRLRVCFAAAMYLLHVATCNPKRTDSWICPECLFAN